MVDTDLTVTGEVVSVLLLVLNPSRECLHLILKLIIGQVYTFDRVELSLLETRRIGGSIRFIVGLSSELLERGTFSNGIDQTFAGCEIPGRLVNHVLTGEVEDLTRPLASAKVNRLLDAEVDLDRPGLLSLQLFDVSRVRAVSGVHVSNLSGNHTLDRDTLFELVRVLLVDRVLHLDSPVSRFIELLRCLKFKRTETFLELEVDVVLGRAIFVLQSIEAVSLVLTDDLREDDPGVGVRSIDGLEYFHLLMHGGLVERRDGVSHVDGIVSLVNEVDRC